MNSNPGFDNNNNLPSSLSNASTAMNKQPNNPQRTIMPIPHHSSIDVGLDKVVWLVNEEVRIPITKPSFIIGASPQCDWVLNKNGIFSRHLEIALINQIWKCRVIGFPAGATLDGVRMEPGRYNSLDDESVIHLSPRHCNYKLTFLNEKFKLYHGKRSRENESEIYTYVEKKFNGEMN